jgi:NAD(P)-dependent dehydrogenase (short-subunit alcohol dehydrogenase family)
MGMMEGKVCIITGGAGSIGLAAAKILLSEGAKVMLVGHNENNLSLAAKSLNTGRVSWGPLKLMLPTPRIHKDTSIKRSLDGETSMFCSAMPVSAV